MLFSRCIYVQQLWEYLQQILIIVHYFLEFKIYLLVYIWRALNRNIIRPYLERNMKLFEFN